MTEQDRKLEQLQRQKEMTKSLYKFQGLYFLVFIFSLVVIYVIPVRDAIGGAFQFILGPLIGFGYKYPVLTIALSGIITGLVSGIPRYFFTDWVKIGKSQIRQRAFSQAMSKAYKDNDRDRVNKLNKMRQEMMLEQQATQMASTTPLIFLSMFTLLIFVWLYYFLSNLKFSYVSFPWASNVNLNAIIGFFPSWIIISFISNIVVGYFITMVIKYVDFTYKIRKDEAEGIA